MKARKLELKSVEMTEEVYDDNKKTFTVQKQGTLHYRELLRQIITGPGPNNQGNSSEEVLKSVLLYGKLKEALKKGDDFVLLDKEDFDYIVNRLNTFRWTVAHPAVSEFITYIRDLKEVEVEEKKEPPASA